MRVRFLRGTALGGVGNDAYPGDELDLPGALAASLVAAGRAIEIPASAAPSPLDQALDAVEQVQHAMAASAPAETDPGTRRKARKSTTKD